MKRKVFNLLCFLLATVAANAYDFSYDYKDNTLYFDKTSDSTCEVTFKDENYNSYNGDIEIPQSTTDGIATYSVTGIGRYAFYDCDNLTSISIPNTVASIDYCAFTGDVALTEIVIPNSVTTIGIGAFASCSGLIEVNIPNSVISIERYAFNYCTGLTEVTIGNAITSIGNEAFCNCTNLKTVTLDDGEGDIVFGSDVFKNAPIETVYVGRGLICSPSEGTYSVYPFVSKGTIKKVIIGNTSVISDHAFSGCYGLTELTISNSVTSIEVLAFRSCGLTEISIPGSVTSVGKCAFDQCNNLNKVTIANSVNYIGDFAFYDCANLKTVTIDDGEANIEFGLDVFKYSPIESLYVGRDFTCTAGENRTEYPFYKKTSIKTLTFGNKVTTIGSNAFEGCSGLTELSLGNSVTTIKSGALANCSSLNELVIPSSVTTIEREAFAQCTGLTEVSIPSSVTSITNAMFKGCSSLTEVTIPNSVTSIGSSAFSNCSKLSTVILTDGASSIEFGGGVFYRSPIETLFIGRNFTCTYSYYDGPFYQNTTLKTLNISNSVNSIVDDAFYGCSSLNTVILADGETNLEFGSDVFRNAQIETLYVGRNFTIPSSSYYAPFYKKTSIKTLSISNSATSICDYAFYGCSGLNEVTIGNSVSSIGGEAFYNCTSLTSLNCLVEDPSKIVMGSYVFNGVPTSTCTLYVPAGRLALYQETDQWKKFVNIKKFGNIYLVDGEAYTNEADKEYVPVTYTRNFTKTTWQAFYVPYDMPYEDWEKYGDIARINNVHQFDTDDDGVIDETKIEFVKVKSGRLVPNIPYVFKPIEGAEITFESDKCMLKAAPAVNGYVDCSSTTTTYTLTGVYSTTSGLYSKGAYTLFDGAFRPIGADNVTLSPFRFYMTITPREGFYNDPSQVSKPQRIRIYVDGEEQTTGFEDLIIQPNDNSTYYDLQGRPVVNPTNGVYLKNGKKIFIHN